MPRILISQPLRSGGHRRGLREQPYVSASRTCRRPSNRPRSSSSYVAASGAPRSGIQAGQHLQVLRRSHRSLSKASPRSRTDRSSGGGMDQTSRPREADSIRTRRSSGRRRRAARTPAERRQARRGDAGEGTNKMLKSPPACARTGWQLPRSGLLERQCQGHTRGKAVASIRTRRCSRLRRRRCQRDLPGPPNGGKARRQRWGRQCLRQWPQHPDGCRAMTDKPVSGPPTGRRLLAVLGARVRRNRSRRRHRSVLHPAERRRTASDNAAGTALATVARQSLSSQTQVSATLGYANASNIVMPTGTAGSASSRLKQSVAQAKHAEERRRQRLRRTAAHSSVSRRSCAPTGQSRRPIAR